MRFSQKWANFWPRYLYLAMYIKMAGLRFSGFLGRRCLILVYDCILAKHTTKWTAAWFSVNSKYPWKTLNQKVVLTTVGGRVLAVNSKTRLVLPEMLSVINYVDSTRKVVSTLFYYVVSTQYVVSTHFRVETTFWVETTIWVETTSSPQVFTRKLKITKMGGNSEICFDRRSACHQSKFYNLELDQKFKFYF